MYDFTCREEQKTKQGRKYIEELAKKIRLIRDTCENSFASLWHLQLKIEAGLKPLDTNQAMHNEICNFFHLNLQ